MMRKTLLAVALMATGFTAHADYQCSVTPRDDVVLNPQTVQVKGENGNLVITPQGNVTFNGKEYNLTYSYLTLSSEFYFQGITMVRLC